MRTLTAAEYAEFLRLSTTCFSCLNYQRQWDFHRDCEFWREGRETETQEEAKVRAQDHPDLSRLSQFDMTQPTPQAFAADTSRTQMSAAAFWFEKVGEIAELL